MSEQENSPTLTMLDLSRQLPEKLKSFFLENGVSIISEEQYQEDTTLSYILVTGMEEFGPINNKYQCVTKDIGLVAFSEVEDLHSFIVFNGKMIVNEKWVGNPVGETILKRFLQGAGSIHIDETLSDHFTTKNTFRIISHLRLGHYGDTMSLDAFDKDFNLVAIRGFLYNSIYYLTYLKQAGISGVPFDVEYAANDDMFMVNIHCSVRNFVSEYLIDSFGAESSVDNLKFLMKSSFLLADFFEITYMQEPSKIVLTGVWQKSQQSLFHGYSSLSINNIQTAKQLEGQVADEVKRIEKAKSGEEVVDYSRKEEELEDKRLPGSAVDMYAPADEDSIFYEDPNLAGELVGHVMAKISEGKDIDIEDMTGDNLIHMIKGHELEKEVIERLREEDVDFVLNKLKKHELTNSYELSVANKREEISDEEYIEQYRKEIKSEVKIRTENTEEIEVVMEEMLLKLEEIVGEIVDGDLKLFKTNKTVAKEMAEKIFVYLKDSVKKGHERFEDEIYKALATVKRREREYINGMLSKSASQSDMGGVSQREEVLLSKLKKNEAEVEELRRKLRASAVALGAAKQVEDEKKEVQKKVEDEIKKIASGEEIEDSEFKDTEKDEDKKQQLLEAIKSGQISEEQALELELLMQKEALMIEKAKKMELELRKQKIETSQKESLYEQQLVTKERLLRAKDTAREKSRENFQMFAARKDKVLKSVTQRMSAMSSELSKLKASGNEGKIKTLDREKITNQKNIDNLRKQIDVMRQKVQFLEGNDKSSQLEEEVRKYKREATGYESKYKSLEKDQDLLRRKIREGEEKLKTLISENKQLKENAPRAEDDAKDDASANQLGMIKEEMRKMKEDLAEKDKQIKAYELKIKQLDSLVQKSAQVKGTQSKAANTETPEIKRLKVQVDRLEKDRAKMIEDARKLKKDSVDAVTQFKKAQAELKGYENRVKAMECEADRSKKKIEELNKKLTAAANAAKKKAA